MTRNSRAAAAAMACVGLLMFSNRPHAEEQMTEAQKEECIAKFHIDNTGTDNQGWKEPAAGSCKVQIKNGHRFPDPKCTPGALNPTVTEEVLRNSGFKTECNRDMGTKEDSKKVVFGWYDLKEDSTCEMDHFVSLEIGGSDMLMNIWPQCGPEGSTGMARDFKQKDNVELYLGEQVKGKGMSQAQARQLITKDWTALIDDAQRAEAAKKKK